jgi:hypothetical protein
MALGPRKHPSGCSGVFASPPVGDLLLCAKHLFVVAKRRGRFNPHPYGPAATAAAFQQRHAVATMVHKLAAITSWQHRLRELS